MSMWTRGDLKRNWSINQFGMTAPAVCCWKKGRLIRSGTQPLSLPPYGWAMDPSDPNTWRRPVRFT